MSSPDRIVVLGASAGGVETLKEVLCELPADFPAALCVVLHIPPYQPSQLPKILSDCGSLKAVHPRDGDSIKPGHVYVAPPDHHLLIDRGRLVVTKGPKENRFRPSIDALFRSAAHSFGSRAVGVILSGALDDGTSGLWSIKRVGGTAVVQQPSDARFESMPKSALEYVEADYNLSAKDIGALLPRLVSNPAAEDTALDEELNSRMQKEIDIAQEGNAFRKGFMKFRRSPAPSATERSSGWWKDGCHVSAVTLAMATPTTRCSRASWNAPGSSCGRSCEASRKA